MNIGQIKIINNLHVQEEIRILFVILNVFAWVADFNIETSMLNKDKSNINFSRNIYIIILICSILVTLYYWYLNYQKMQSKSDNDPNLGIRNVAYIISILSLLMLLYVQITDKSLFIEETSIL